MSQEERNNLFYVCSLIEYIVRITKNKVADIVRILGKEEIERQLDLAEVNHCLSFEQVSDEIIEEFEIKQGIFDAVGECLYEVMTSFITEEISDYNTSVYYSSREYLKACYDAGTMLM